MSRKDHPRRTPQTNNFCDPELRRARHVRPRCCRSPSGHRRNNESTPATASSHSGSPPLCPTCAKVSSVKLRTSRARTRARGELGFGEPVVVGPVAVREPQLRSHTEPRSVLKLPGPEAKRGLVPGHRTYAARAPYLAHKIRRTIWSRQLSRSRAGFPHSASEPKLFAPDNTGWPK